MKPALMFAAAAWTAAVSTGVRAQEFYVAPLIAQATVQDQADGKATPTIAVLRVGMPITEWFGVEARLGRGTSSGAIGTTEIDLRISNLYGVYARGVLPFTPTFSAYGVLGYTHVKLNTETLSTGVSGSASDAGTSIGLGLEFLISERINAGVEWASLNRRFLDLNVRVETTGLSLLFKF